jgi:hypothetical protein
VESLGSDLAGACRSGAISRDTQRSFERAQLTALVPNTLGLPAPI